MSCEVPFQDCSGKLLPGIETSARLNQQQVIEPSVFPELVSNAGIYDKASMYAIEELWFEEREMEGTPWTAPENYRKWAPMTSTGGQLLQSNTLQDSLHPILKELEHVKGGFNIFRRFRISKLKKSDCPEFLQHFWSGHAHTHVSERYTKLEDRDFRLEWAEKIGMGFELPRAAIAPRAPLIVFRKTG